MFEVSQNALKENMKVLFERSYCCFLTSHLFCFSCHSCHAADSYAMLKSKLNVVLIRTPSHDFFMVTGEGHLGSK